MASHSSPASPVPQEPRDLEGGTLCCLPSLRWGSLPSWGTQYTGPSSVVSKEEKEALEDQEGDGCSSPDGGSRKLQLSVSSRS